GRACSTRSSAARAHAHARSNSPITRSWCARPTTFSPGAAAGRRSSSRPRWRKPPPRWTTSAPRSTPTALPRSRPCRRIQARGRLAAPAAVEAHQGITPGGVEEADGFAVHQEGGFFCVQVFFSRTGQNWGNRAYFPKADRTLGPGEVLGAFLAQFYDDKPTPR